MTEEENCGDISDIIEDTEQYVDTENQDTETIDAENVDTIQDSEIVNSDDQIPEEKKQQSKTEAVRSSRLPIARIKNIMKMDPDVSVLSGDAVFLVTKATELFLETIAKETYAYTSANKRKTIAKKDLYLVINKVDCLCFLEGAMDF